MLNAFYVLIRLILTPFLSHFTNEEIKAQRGEVTYTQGHTLVSSPVGISFQIESAYTVVLLNTSHSLGGNWVLN